MKVRFLLSADLCGGTPRRSRHPLQFLDLMFSDDAITGL
jgi:hypothetical protein